MRGWRGVAILVVAVVIAATGCLRTDVDVKVNDDGSGSITTDIYFANETLEQMGLTADQLLEVAKVSLAGIENGEVSSVATANAKGIRLELPFDDYRQVGQALTNSDLQGQPVRAFSKFQISEGADGNWTLSATVDPVGFEAIKAQVPTDFQGLAVDPDDAEVNFSVTLPGKVARSNADRTDGGTATWKLNTADAETTLTMENEPSGLSTLQMILIGVGGLFVLGFILVLVTAAGGKRRRRKRAAVVDRPGSWQPPAPVAAVPKGGRDVNDLPPLEWSRGGGPPVGYSPLGGEQVNDTIAAAIAEAEGIGAAPQRTGPHPPLPPPGPPAPMGTPAGPPVAPPAAQPPVAPPPVGPPVIPETAPGATVPNGAAPNGAVSNGAVPNGVAPEGGGPHVVHGLVPVTPPELHDPSTGPWSPPSQDATPAPHAPPPLPPELQQPAPPVVPGAPADGLHPHVERDAPEPLGDWELPPVAREHHDEPPNAPLN